MDKKDKSLIGLAAIGAATIGAKKLIELMSQAKKQSFDQELSSMILFIVFLSESSLTQDEQDKVRNFRSELKDFNQRYADEFDTFIAGFLIMSTGLWESHNKKNTQFDDAYAPYRVGIEMAEKWVKKLLSIPDFEKRIEFLKDEKVIKKSSTNNNAISKVSEAIVEESVETLNLTSNFIFTTAIEFLLVFLLCLMILSYMYGSLLGLLASGIPFFIIIVIFIRKKN